MRYKYYINNIEVFPLNAGSERILYEKKIASSVILQKNVDRTFIFDSKGSFNFKNQEALDLSEELNFIITDECDGITKTIINLVFTTAEGTFNNDRCTYEIKPRNREDFPTDIPVNILLTPGMVTSNIPAVSGSSYYQTFPFANVLLYVAQISNPNIKSIVSDFFQINPVNISSFALPGVSNVWTDMRLASLSYIQYPVPTEFARTEFVTFQELLDDLNGLFRVFWYIDDDNNLRIEHEHFFEGVVSIDLTQEKYKKYLVASDKYSFDLSNYPKVEKLTVLDSRNYAQIRYVGLANINQNSTQNVFTTKKIRTDYNNIRYGSGNSTVDGVFLICNDSLLSQSAVSPYFLFENLHTYNRCDTSAFFESENFEEPPGGGSPVFFNRSGGFQSKSTKAVKLQRDLVVPFCCNDEIDNQTQVKTNLSDELGDGYISKAEIDLKSRNINLSLKYKIPHINFEPTDLTGLDLWLKIEGITWNSITGKISQWNDFSGNNRHATQSVPSDSLSVDDLLNPTSVVFLGSQTTPAFMNVPSFQLFPNKRGTFIILYKRTFDGVHHIFSTENTNPGDYFFNLYMDATPVSTILKINSGDINVPQIISFKEGLCSLVRNADSQIKGRFNSMDIRSYNNEAITVYNPMNVANVDISLNPIILGSNLNMLPVEQTISDNSIEIQEIIIYNRVLEEFELDKIELYLANKGIYKINTQLNF